MVPTLKIEKNSLQSNGFINAYYYDSSKEENYEDCIYLLFKPKNLDRFREFLDNEYERTKDVVEDYDYESGYVIVVYKLNKLFKKDFELVKEGLYSKTSKKFQDMFPKVVKIIRNGLHKDELSLQTRIFNKSPDLIEFWEEKLNVKFKDDYEAWRGWDNKDETLDINKLKEYV